MHTEQWSSVRGQWSWKTREDGKHEFLGDFAEWWIECADPNCFIRMRITKGFITDGASTPKAFQWVLKSWYGDIRDRVAISHDIGYALKLMNREQVDDILRGGCRDVIKLGRVKAALVDKAVELFAGGDAHWGNMEPDNVNENGTYKFDVEIIKLSDLQ